MVGGGLFPSAFRHTPASSRVLTADLKDLKGLFQRNSGTLRDSRGEIVLHATSFRGRIAQGHANVTPHRASRFEFLVLNREASSINGRSERGSTRQHAAVGSNLAMASPVSRSWYSSAFVHARRKIPLAR